MFLILTEIPAHRSFIWSGHDSFRPGASWICCETTLGRVGEGDLQNDIRLLKFSFYQSFNMQELQFVQMRICL